MSIEDMAEAIGRAHGAALDGLTRALWAAVAHGECSDDDAERLAEAIQARRHPTKYVASAIVGKSDNRGVLRSQETPQALHSARAMVGMGIPHIGGIAPHAANPDAKRLGFQPDARRRAVQRPPVRSEAIERRRRLAASGPMPPALAQRFTTGELAVMRIVGDAHLAHGSCVLCLDAIAARAGVSRTLAKNAIRQARRLGLVEVRERRRTGAKSLPNVVTVIDREWLAWMKRGATPRQRGVLRFEEAGKGPHTVSTPGVRNPTTTDTRGYQGKRSTGLGAHAQGSGHSHKRPYGTGIGNPGKSPQAPTRPTAGHVAKR
jgi:hypothetical protein